MEETINEVGRQEKRDSAGKTLLEVFFPEEEPKVGPLTRERMREIWEDSRKKKACTMDQFFDRWWNVMEPVIDAINRLNEKIERTNEGCQLLQQEHGKEGGGCPISPKLK